MSEVNADGNLLEPHRHLLQEAQFLTNAQMAEDPEGTGTEGNEHEIHAADGRRAGKVGGIPHMNANTAVPPGSQGSPSQA